MTFQELRHQIRTLPTRLKHARQPLRLAHAFCIDACFAIDDGGYEAGVDRRQRTVFARLRTVLLDTRRQIMTSPADPWTAEALLWIDQVIGQCERILRADPCTRARSSECRAWKQQLAETCQQLEGKTPDQQWRILEHELGPALVEIFEAHIRPARDQSTTENLQRLRTLLGTMFATARESRCEYPAAWLLWRDAIDRVLDVQGAVFIPDSLLDEPMDGWRVGLYLHHGHATEVQRWVDQPRQGETPIHRAARAAVALSQGDLEPALNEAQGLYQTLPCRETAALFAIARLRNLDVAGAFEVAVSGCYHSVSILGEIPRIDQQRQLRAILGGIYPLLDDWCERAHLDAADRRALAALVHPDPTRSRSRLEKLDPGFDDRQRRFTTVALANWSRQANHLPAARHWLSISLSVAPDSPWVARERAAFAEQWGPRALPT